jgi:hypothetical protein
MCARYPSAINRDHQVVARGTASASADGVSPLQEALTRWREGGAAASLVGVWKNSAAGQRIEDGRYIGLEGVGIVRGSGSIGHNIRHRLSGREDRPFLRRLGDFLLLVKSAAEIENAHNKYNEHGDDQREL